MSFNAGIFLPQLEFNKDWNLSKLNLLRGGPHCIRGCNVYVA
jgi:hypothetical protein